MKLSRDLMRFFLIPIVLLAGIGFAAAFIIFYTTTTQTENGTIVDSNWPKDFTLGFSEYISVTDHKCMVSDKGTKLLQQNGLWMQVLDSTGAEIYDYEKPITVPDFYEPYELLDIYQNGNEKSCVFVSSVIEGDHLYIYLIGFPVKISKVVTYVDTARYNSSKVLIIGIAVATALLLVSITLFYNTMIVKNLERLGTSLRAVATRSYTPCKRKVFLREVYEGIDALNHDIAIADKRREQDRIAKEEWLANITHDLKTPLAPIRGYAELLLEDQNDSMEQVQCYAKIILKNTLYVQQLVDDLKLTYQLQSNMLPLKKENKDIIRFVKEVIIDILNSPEYQDRKITFNADCDHENYDYDQNLFRRALDNIIINALKHNKPDVEINIAITCDTGIKMCISDNGCGMTKQEQKGLFTRYYRGTSTEVNAEGSGLGMAIAKQIVEAHKGKISVESTLNMGTTVIIELPVSFKV